MILKSIEQRVRRLRNLRSEANRVSEIITIRGGFKLSFNVRANQRQAAYSVVLVVHLDNECAGITIHHITFAPEVELNKRISKHQIICHWLYFAR